MYSEFGGEFHWSGIVVVFTLFNSWRVSLFNHIQIQLQVLLLTVRGGSDVLYT